MGLYGPQDLYSHIQRIHENLLTKIQFSLTVVITFYKRGTTIPTIFFPFKKLATNFIEYLQT